MTLTEEEINVIKRESQLYYLNGGKNKPGIHGYATALTSERIKAKKLLDALGTIAARTGENLTHKRALKAISEYNKSVNNGL